MIPSERRRRSSSVSSVRTPEGLAAQLEKKIHDRSALVGVVGLGYVGLPFAVEKAKVGFRVVGIDRSADRVARTNRGESYILPDVRPEDLQKVVSQKRLHAYPDFRYAPTLDVIVIAVPTPLTRNLTPDLQYIEKVTHELVKHLRPGQLICLESTTYPGTTEEVMLPILRASGLEVERDFFLAHSPERVDPGNKRYTTKNTTKVVGGVGPLSHRLAVAFYRETIEKVVGVSSAKTAELVKVFENTFRAVNIALVNELAQLCDRMNLSVWEVLDAAFTKPFGILPFYPGPGVGGHCIPIDPHYLEWKAKEYNFDTHFIALAGEINRKMPEFVRDKAIRLLNRAGVPTSDARVLFLGVAYKKDLDDWRHSPAIDVIQLLEAQGATISYHDPHIPSIEIAGKARRSEALSETLLARQDLVIITSDHTSVDYAWVVRHARAVLDTRNATRKVKGSRERITLL